MDKRYGSLRFALLEALQIKKDQDFKYIWTLNGRIYLRENMETPIIGISCSDDLDAL